MEHVEIEDPKSLITKTQKKKVRKWVSDNWQSEEEFYNQIDDVLGLIHYPEDVKGYDMLLFDVSPDTKRIVLKFSQQEAVVAKNTRDELKKKLRARLQRDKIHDVAWKTYFQLKTRLPHVAEKFLPNPDQVKENMEVYRGMLNSIPSHHPVHEYLKLMIVS